MSLALIRYNRDVDEIGDRNGGRERTRVRDGDGDGDGDDPWAVLHEDGPRTADQPFPESSDAGDSPGRSPAQ